MSIDEVYQQYQIPPQLQEHMLRVAAVGSHILNYIAESIQIDETAILQTLLLHDMGNIIKFNFDYTQQFMKNENLDIMYWKNIQAEFKKKYGEDEHIATDSIAKEIGVSEYVNYLINHRGSSHLDMILGSADWNLKLASYPDFRVDPYGVVTVKQRFEEVMERYKNSQHVLGDIEKTKKKLEQCLELEEQIQNIVSIDLETINNNTIAQYISPLKKCTIV